MRTAMVAAGLMLVAAAVDAYEEPPRALSVGGALGRIDSGHAARLDGYDAGISLGLNASYRFANGVAIALDLQSFSQAFATPSTVRPPFLGTVDDELDIGTSAAALQVQYSIPVWRTRLHLGVGAGYYRHDLTLDGTLLGIPGTYVDKSDSGVGTQSLVRWDLRLANDWWLGAEYRRVDATADFGEWTGGEVDVGGTFRLITLRKQFDGTPWSPPARTQP